MGKKPRRAANVPQFSKLPRGAELVEVIRKKQFCWRVEELDWEGQWGWSQASRDEILRTIVPKLHNYESMTWAQVEGPSGSHSVEFDQLCPEAQARLTEIGRGELENLFSVRITGEQRVWGIKDVAILRLIWWDPSHSVCPSEKKHT
jgi:hypothetical protein